MGFGSKGQQQQPQVTQVTAPNPQTANQPMLEQFAGARLAASAPWMMGGLRPMDYFQGMQTQPNLFPQMQPGQMAMGQWGQQGQPMMQAPGFGQYPQAPQGFGIPNNPWVIQNQQMAQQPPPGFQGGV